MDLTVFFIGVAICCLVMVGAALLPWVASKRGGGSLTWAVFLICALALLAVAVGALYTAGG